MKRIVLYFIFGGILLGSPVSNAQIIFKSQLVCDVKDFVSQSFMDYFFFAFDYVDPAEDRFLIGASEEDREKLLRAHPFFTTPSGFDWTPERGGEIQVAYQFPSRSQIGKLDENGLANGRITHWFFEKEEAYDILCFECPKSSGIYDWGDAFDCWLKKSGRSDWRWYF